MLRLLSKMTVMAMLLGMVSGGITGSPAVSAAGETTVYYSQDFEGMTVANWTGAANETKEEEFRLAVALPASPPIDGHVKISYRDTPLNAPPSGSTAGADSNQCLDIYSNSTTTVGVYRDIGASFGATPFSFEVNAYPVKHTGTHAQDFSILLKAGNDIRLSFGLASGGNLKAYNGDSQQNVTNVNGAYKLDQWNNVKILVYPAVAPAVGKFDVYINGERVVHQFTLRNESKGGAIDRFQVVGQSGFENRPTRFLFDDIRISSDMTPPLVPAKSSFYDFNGAEDGKTPLNFGLTTISGSNPSASSYVRAAEKVPGDHYLKIYDVSGASTGQGIRLPFSSLGGIVVFDMDFQFGDESESAVALNIQNGSAWPPPISLSISGGDIKTQGSVNPTTLAEFDTKQWFNMKFVANTTAGTFDFYINNELKRAGMAFRDNTTTAAFDNLSIAGSTSSGPAKIRTVNIDNLKIYEVIRLSVINTNIIGKNGTVYGSGGTIPFNPAQIVLSMKNSGSAVVDTATCTSGNIKIADKATGQIAADWNSGVYNPTAGTFTINLANALKGNKVYVVTVENLTDNAQSGGVPMQNPYRFEFVTSAAPNNWIVTTAEFTTAAGGEITSLNYAESLRGTVSVTNNFEEEKNVCVLLVLYNGQKMDECIYVEETVAAGAQDDISVYLRNLSLGENASQTHWVKVFVWDSIEHLTPLGGASKFN